MSETTENSNIHRIQVIDRDLRERHQRLVTALGSEANPAQWMTFMETVAELIPHVVVAAGRPSIGEVQNSMIGRLGFSSWREMIETTRESNGLEWSWGGWNAFRRAWSLVEQYPYLRELPVRAGWLNSVSAELKRSKTDFPSDLESYQALLESREQARIEAKAETLTDLKTRLEAAESASAQGMQQLTELSSANHLLTEQVAQLQQQLSLANKENGRLLSTVEQLEKQASILSDSKQSLSDDLDKMSKYTAELENTLKTASKSLWSRLKFVFRHHKS